MEKQNVVQTFSKKQKERQSKLIADTNLREKADKINGLNYLIVKGISYIINEPEKFEHNPTCEISNKLKEALKTQGKFGFIYV